MFQSNKIKFIDLSVCNRKFDTITEEIDKSKISFGYLDFIDDSIAPQVIRFGNNNESAGNFRLLKYDISVFITVFKFLKKNKNSIILFHGFTFPVSFLCLNFFLRKKRKWIVQHHAEQPSKNRIKRYLQKIAYSKADAYMFVSREQAIPFLTHGLVQSKSQVFEVMECSTSFALKDKLTCRQQLNLSADKLVLIYVSGLDQNKDPMCLLQAVRDYRDEGNDFELYIFYNKNDLLPEVTSFINENQLQDMLFLKGNIENSQLENWYNAADFYISCSHSEGSGVALAEAMACGCIPIVSNIPSFKKMTCDGDVGLLFEKGNPNSLTQKLLALSHTNIASERIKTNNLFKQNISFKAIGNHVSGLVKNLNAQL